MTKRVAIFALCVMSLCIQAPGQQPAPTVPAGLNLNGASLLEVINLLAQDLHINYILDSSVHGGTVTINTYGQIRDVDLRPLLETILRMNNLAMVQAGNIYRIIPIASIAKQPVSPITEIDPSKIVEDERIVLNLVFLRYVTSSEMAKILSPFVGDGSQIVNYDAANLLILLDNSRNMRRTLELINLFDNDAFAGQRVRAYEIKNGRPSDVTKELEEIFKAYALAGEKGSSPIRFLPIDRINTILAVSPNPSSFDEVQKWVDKLDIPAKVTAGSTDNYVYRLRYARAEVMGSVVMQLYGAPGYPIGQNLYGGMPGNSSYPATGMSGSGGFPGGIGGANGGGYGGTYGGGYNGGYGGNQYGGGGFGQGNQYGGGYPQAQQAQAGFPTGAAGTNPAAAGLGTAGAAIAQAGIAPTGDRTGSYLGFGGIGGYRGPRIIPNPFDNTLLVQGTPTEWEQIRHLLDQLDIPPRQVLIDAKIYEVDLTGDFAYGVESYLQTKGSALPAGASMNLLASTVIAGASGTAPGLGLSAGALVGSSRQLLGILQASETSSKARVLSAPSVIATDSIPASITVGTSVPTLSAESVNGITQGGTSQFTNSITNTSTGIGLTILARINPSGIVTMVIDQDITAPVPNPTDTTINSPSFSQRNVSTQVTVQDGDTIAIGGIITENITDTSAGIPFLNRIPYIGAAFGSKTHHKDRTELIVFLTPRVIYDTTQMSDATEELKQKVRGLRKVIGRE
jgi:general secretion pathway protein D